ncbi:ATP-dependent helicase HepA [compost metagenome]
MEAFITIAVSKFSKRTNLLFSIPIEHNHIPKSIDGRTWSNEFRCWSLPLSENSIEHARLMCDLHGISLRESDRINAFLSDLSKTRDEVAAVISRGDADIDNLSFASKLRDYQRVGIAFAQTVGNTLIADDPGLGKTLQAIGVAELNPKKDGVLVICPTAARHGWGQEIDKWTDSSWMIAAGATSKTKVKRLNTEADYKIINYGMATYYKEYLLSQRWSTLILDEAHVVKNKKTVLFDILSKLQVDRKIFLTANPMMNHVYDLWALLHLLYPSKYSNYWSFVRKYCIMIENHFGSKPGRTNPETVPELRKELATIMIRREKEAVLHELPPKIYQKSHLTLSKEHKKIYDELLKEKRISLMSAINVVQDISKFTVTSSTSSKIIYKLTPEQYRKIANAYGDVVYKIHANNYMEISREVFKFRMSSFQYAICCYNDNDQLATAIEMRGGVSVANMLEQTTRERQLLISPWMVDKSLPTCSPKIAEIINMIPDYTEEGKKVIIYSQWTRTFELFEKELTKAGIPHLEFSGRNSSSKNDSNKVMFMEDEKHKVLLLSTIAGGVALNLQRASVGFRTDKLFNPALDTQAEDRMYRMGQKDSVLIHDFIIEGTIEEEIEKVLKARKEDFAMVMDRKDILDLLK